VKSRKVFPNRGSNLVLTKVTGYRLQVTDWDLVIARRLSESWLSSG